MKKNAKYFNVASHFFYAEYFFPDHIELTIKNESKDAEIT